MNTDIPLDDLLTLEPVIYPVPDQEPDYAPMVPFTLIDWINGKAVKLYEDFIEFGFDIDKNPGWWDMPF